MVPLLAMFCFVWCSYASMVFTDDCPSHNSKSCATFPTGLESSDGLKVCTEVPPRIQGNYTLIITIESKILMRDVFIEVNEHGSRIDFLRSVLDGEPFAPSGTDFGAGYSLGILEEGQVKRLEIPAESSSLSDSSGACLWAKYTPFLCSCGHKIEFNLDVEVFHPCTPPSYALITLKNLANTALTDIAFEVICSLNNIRVGTFQLKNIPLIQPRMNLTKKMVLNLPEESCRMNYELSCEGITSVEDEKRTFTKTFKKQECEVDIKLDDSTSAKLYATEVADLCFTYGIGSIEGTCKYEDFNGTFCDAEFSITHAQNSTSEGLALYEKESLPGNYCITAVAIRPGEYSLEANVKCKRSGKCQHCQATKNIKIVVLPLSAILVEVLDVRDALFVGEKVYYEVVIINQGPEPLTNIEVFIGWEDTDMKFIKASGATVLLPEPNDYNACSSHGYRLMGNKGSALHFYEKALAPWKWYHNLKCFKPLPILPQLPETYVPIPENWCFYKAGDINETCAKEVLQRKEVDTSKEMSANRARWVIEMEAMRETGTRLVVWVADARLPSPTVEIETTQLHKAFRGISNLKLGTKLQNQKKLLVEEEVEPLSSSPPLPEMSTVVEKKESDSQDIPEDAFEDEVEVKGKKVPLPGEAPLP